MEQGMTIERALAQIDAQEGSRSRAGNMSAYGGHGGGLPSVPHTKDQTPRQRAEIAAEAEELDAMNAATRARFGLKAAARKDEGRRLKDEVKAEGEGLKAKAKKADAWDGVEREGKPSAGRGGVVKAARYRRPPAEAVPESVRRVPYLPDKEARALLEVLRRVARFYGARRSVMRAGEIPGGVMNHIEQSWSITVMQADRLKTGLRKIAASGYESRGKRLRLPGDVAKSIKAVCAAGGGA